MKRKIFVVAVIGFVALMLTSCSRIVSCNIYGQIQLHLINAQISDVDDVHVILYSAPGPGDAYSEIVYPKREDGYCYKFTTARYGKNILRAKVRIKGKVYEPEQTFKISEGETKNIDLFLKFENYNPNY